MDDNFTLMNNILRDSTTCEDLCMIKRHVIN